MASPLIKIFIRSEILARKLLAKIQINVFKWIFIMLSILFTLAFLLSNQTCTFDSCARNIAGSGYDDEWHAKMETRHRHRDNDDKQDKQDKQDKDWATTLNTSFDKDIQTFDVGDSGRKNGNSSGGHALK